MNLHGGLRYFVATLGRLHVVCSAGSGAGLAAAVVGRGACQRRRSRRRL